MYVCMYVKLWFKVIVTVKGIIITSSSLRLSSRGNQSLHVLALLLQVPRSPLALYHLTVEPHLEEWRRAMQETKVETATAQVAATTHVVKAIPCAKL